MKKLFTLSLLFVLIYPSVWSQCTPDAVFVGSGAKGFSPAPTAGLPPATQSLPYSETITVVVPTDTTLATPVGTYSLTVNYWEFTAASGLPTGITWTCGTTPCKWNGGQNGCMLVAGTSSALGTYTVQISSSLNVTIPASVPIVGGQTFDLPLPVPYSMEVVDPNSVIDELNSNTFSVAQNVPNPANGLTSISFNVMHPAEVVLSVMNQLGQEVMNVSQFASSGLNVMNIQSSNFKPGVYYYQLTNGKEKTQVRRMLITE